MRIGLVDLAPLDYSPSTPLERPLGGMQSGLCYLASALSARGHNVSLINRITEPGLYSGINCINFRSALNAAALGDFDVVVSISCRGVLLRERGVKCPMILWTGHDTNVPEMRRLKDDKERSAWNKIVLKSEWQKERYAAAFPLERGDLAVLRNAMSPAFASATRRTQYFFEEARPPVLIYSSTPFRGLKSLVRAFPLLRSSVPGCTARIYSSMAVYAAPEPDRLTELYDVCRSTEGIAYYGSVSQSELAAAYAEADVFAYPSTYEETSCISLIEAMASACLVVSHDIGALSETAAGRGHLCPRFRGTLDEFAAVYARFAAAVIRKAFQEPEHYRQMLDGQREFYRENYTWPRRAQEWEDLLHKVTREPRRTTVGASGPAQA